MHVILTRPARDAREWAVALSSVGHSAAVLPLLEVAAAVEPHAVSAAYERLGEFDAAMFVSGNAVDHFFGSNWPVAQVFKDFNAIKTRAYATGPGTVAALIRAGVPATSIDAPGPDSPQFDSEALWALVGLTVGPGFRALIVRGAGAPPDNTATHGQGRDWFAQQVLSASGTVEFVVAYRRVAVRLQGDDLTLARQAAADRSLWIFSSSEAIGNLVASCPGQDWSQARAVVTHPRIGDAARGAGFGAVHASRPGLTSVLASIDYLETSS